jgi:WD40 repeat protein
MWNLLPPEEPVYLDVESSRVRLAVDKEPPPALRPVPAGRSRCLRGHTAPVYAATFLPGDAHLVSVSEDTTVRLWDRRTGAGLVALHGHVYPVWCVAADCLGVNFVTGSHDRTARLWRPEVAHPLRVYCGHEGDVDCVRQEVRCAFFTFQNYEVYKVQVQLRPLRWGEVCELGKVK